MLPLAATPSLRRGATPHVLVSWKNARRPYPGTAIPKGRRHAPPRTKVIMVIACGVGIAAGVRTYLASRSFPQALLAAGTATGSSVDLFRQFIGTDPDHSASDHRGIQDDNHDGVEQRRI
jgi:hypothetical protein